MNTEIAKILTSGLDLIVQREILKDQSYSSAFPGSRQWTTAKMYEAALAEFDMSHPEIVAKVKANQSAKAAKRSADIDDLDVMGI